MDELNIVTKLHQVTERDYLGRVNSVDKAWAAAKAEEWGYDYWDGDRSFGYGGFKYIPGYNTKFAKQLNQKFGLQVILEDERWTSALAKVDGPDDAVAAAIILEGVLNASAYSA